MYTWMRIGKVSRVAYFKLIRWKVPCHRTPAKQAHHGQFRILAITQTQHPGPCLTSPLAIRTDDLVTNL